jgi:predicted CoA-binding protein
LNLKKLLKETKNIAIIGASSNPERDSFKVMKFLMNYGYGIFPVNPKEKNILGRKCYANLKEIEERIDMVDIFRAKEFILAITNEAIEINANIIWTQEGIVDKNAASLAKKSGLTVVMDRCPKKILES